MNNSKRYLLAICCLVVFSITGAAQDITITSKDDASTYDTGGKKEGKVVFEANSDNLYIEENSGSEVTGPEKLPNGKYSYTAIGDFSDANPKGSNFTFLISVKGSAESQSCDVFLAMGECRKYEIKVTERPFVLKVQKLDQTNVFREDDSGAVIVSCKNEKLQIKAYGKDSLAHTPVNDNITIRPPVLNKDMNVYEYVIKVMLADSVSKKREYTVEVSIDGKHYEVTEIGRIPMKMVYLLSAEVIQKASCFERNISNADNSFINGQYKEAYGFLKEAMDCEDKREDTETEQKKMKNMRILAGALQRVIDHSGKAESFRRQEMVDSCMFYYQDAYKYARAILKMNPSDPYCLQLQQRYNEMVASLPRMVSGKLVDATRMDMDKNNVPIPNAYVMCYKYAVEYEKVKGTDVPKFGRVLEKTMLGTTDENGAFQVAVPRDTPNTAYELRFTFEKNDDFKSNTDSGFYRPTKADVQKDILIRFAPKNRINRNRD